MQTKNPRKPKLKVPVTSLVGWWPHQHSLLVTDLKITVLECNLNAFVTKSLICYSIKGTLKGNRRSEPFIEKIHVSERIVERDEASSKVMLELTPVVKVKQKKSYNGDLISFQLENEHRIQSVYWGHNLIIFKCGMLMEEINFHQGK